MKLKIIFREWKNIPPENTNSQKCFFDFSLQNVKCVWMGTVSGSEIPQIPRMRLSTSIFGSLSIQIQQKLSR